MNKKERNNTRLYRLYIGNSNWVTLPQKTTDDLNAIFQKGEATRYEISPGLYFDILPNDVDCNSKNTDLCRLMRADLSYEQQQQKDDDDEEEDQECVQQQLLSSFVKKLLESQGTMDAFPPTKKTDEPLPRVLDLSTHRHLSLVPTPPLGTYGRRPSSSTGNATGTKTSSLGLSSGMHHQGSGNSNRKRKGGGGVSSSPGRRQQGLNNQRKAAAAAAAKQAERAMMEEENNKAMLTTMMKEHELTHGTAGAAATTSLSPMTAHDDAYPFYGMGMQQHTHEQHHPSPFSSVMLSRYERDLLPPLPSLHSRENQYSHWSPSAHHYYQRQQQQAHSPIMFHGGGGGGGNGDDHYHGILDAHNPWMSPQQEATTTGADNTDDSYFNKPNYMVAAAAAAAANFSPFPNDAATEAPTSSQQQQHYHPDPPPPPQQSPTASHETLLSQDGTTTATTTTSFPFLQPGIHVVQQQQTLSEDGPRSI
ncbi:hypothetical protein O0I10_009949 [Lichtheimia ornata]|uniref:Uncharacterized protein n=1 Tax=Lichtheimia ornata TaxID=688661 RepID=A0AAD7XVJ9_9FUNG|nr:uncharacterized protein O0I10_009949 [Lichtheimia ornata]KAJ8654381.1 hypothetical protein O0I10_009949 [Lichtheimia ornata]